MQVRQALLKAGRGDLIGNGCDALIPSKPPHKAIERRRADAIQRFKLKVFSRNSGWHR